jgi:hypothetical protein
MANNKKTGIKKRRGFVSSSSQQSASVKASSNASKIRKLIVISIIVLIAGTGGWYFFLRGESNTEVVTPSGLKYTDINVGSGSTPKRGDRVTVHYTGTLENGTKFDSSLDRSQPFEFVLGVGQVIKGWDEGLSSMKVGGKRKLIIPPDLGYGSTSSGKIPANSTLYFDVELLSVN